MTTNHEQTFSVGKYLVSPLTRFTEAGTYSASVSISSGNGKARHDRVFRFVPCFSTREGARRYASEQGLSWVRNSTHA